MPNNRSYDEDVSYWLGYVDGQETDASDDPFLAHLTDDEIVGLGDSYDDGRIDRLAWSYIELRKRLLEKIN